MKVKSAMQALESFLPGGRALLRRIEPLLYLCFAGFCVLWVARWFYGSLRLQSLYSLLWSFPEAYDRVVHDGLLGDWSAPLDDVFIHFDFARSTARGYPFQWSEGNGYSSGGTSLLYPWVLAVGYWLGWRELSLMVWAAVVACVSVFAFAWGLRRMYRALPVWTTYLAPVTLLSVGALDWTLFSGMEVALLLALWAGALVAWDDLWVLLAAGGVANQQTGAPASQRRLLRSALGLGLWGAVVVLGRPEGAVCVAVFSLMAAGYAWRRRGRASALGVLLAAAVPGALVVLGQSLANYLLTGQVSAAGALVKLELNDPGLSLSQVWDQWVFHLVYQIRRVTEYHFASRPELGWLYWPLALAPWFNRRTRRFAALLWASCTLWVLVTAFNGQVRWQNERYAMPAVAWFLAACGLGLGSLLTLAFELRASCWRRLGLAAIVASIPAVIAWQQLPVFRGQVWFFGRASRNILDQHVQVGYILRHRLAPPPRRVLLGDAGAIPYVSDLPALDLIGLGGYADLPFASATRWSVGAAAELIERMPADDRPDVMALYPSWWGVFPSWFSKRIIHAVPVRGNVICGGASKVIYQASWEPFVGSAQPVGLGEDLEVVDSLDLADIVDEELHHFELSTRPSGYVSMKLLAHPTRPQAELWDAGRLFTPGSYASFDVTNLSERLEATLVLRVAPAQPVTLRVANGSRELVRKRVAAGDDWQHVFIPLPAGAFSTVDELRLEAVEGACVIYHLWLAQPR